MKIAITPDYLDKHRLQNMPATLTICQKGIFLNKKAVSVLAIKLHDYIALEFEDGYLYMREFSQDGFRVYAEIKGGSLAHAVGLVPLIESLFKKGYKTYLFEIGEFKAGRRMLTLISKAK